MVIHRSYGHSLYNNYYAEYVSLKKKKSPSPQISGEGTDQKHMSFFSWPNRKKSEFLAAEYINLVTLGKKSHTI